MPALAPERPLYPDQPGYASNQTAVRLDTSGDELKMPAETRRVRILVAIDSDSAWISYGDGGSDDSDCAQYIDDEDLSHHRAYHWIEADVPIPALRTIEASVQDDKPIAQGADALRAARLERALRSLELAASEFLRVTLCDRISDSPSWRQLSGAVTRALECADGK